MLKKIMKILGIIMLIILLLIVFYFLFFYDFSGQNQALPKVSKTATNKQEDEKNNKTPSVPASQTGNETINRPSYQAPSQDETTLKVLAFSFAERFGSFSNHSNYSNIEDLKNFMSQKMLRWADNFLLEARSKKYDELYYGISTKALNATTELFSENLGEAKFIVSTQRREGRGDDGEADSFAQDIEINFVKENGAWKVDSANWIE